MNFDDSNDRSGSDESLLPNRRFPALVALFIVVTASLTGVLTFAGASMFNGPPSESHNLAAILKRIWVGNRSEISVLSASYGLNCRDFPVPHSFPNRAYEGNASVAVKQACDGSSRCHYRVDVSKLGDPANSCPKEFLIKYMCTNSNMHEMTVALAAEANGKSVELDCTKLK